jgi:hypothetical protein
MPYKLEGSTVMVQRAGKWQVLKKHPNRAKASAHLRALEANVGKAHR